MGRMSAGMGFLNGFLRHSGVERFYCCTPSQKHFEQFKSTAIAQGAEHTPAQWIRPDCLELMSEPGCLFRPDPGIGMAAWQRRFVGGNAYSLCGVTYTICSAPVMDMIGALLTAPVQPWDAVVCASNAAKRVIEQVVQQWGEYLAERLNAKPIMPVQLPVIPLGVDCDAFKEPTKPGVARHLIRRKLGIGVDHIAVLFVGRLSFHGKAHPLPMYLALEQAAQQTGRTIHLIQAGMFTSEPVEKEFRDGALRFCPSVKSHFIHGRSDDMPLVWHGADLFTSLSDNIQETFGLTLVEAMAAGLPQVVSDWDGYRDTVRHGVDGFRVPTITPPKGSGSELAYRFATGVDSYDRYIGHASQFTAVDVEASTRAYVELINNPELRQKMGQSGQQRARQHFDWSVIVKAYQELWAELAQRRATATELAPRRRGRPAHPLRNDPFTAFSTYPSVSISPETVVCLGPNGNKPARVFLQTPMTNFAASLLLPTGEIERLIDRLQTGPQRVDELLSENDVRQHAATLRTLVWCLKIDLIRLEDPVRPKNCTTLT